MFFGVCLVDTKSFEIEKGRSEGLSTESIDQSQVDGGANVASSDYHLQLPFLFLL